MNQEPKGKTGDYIERIRKEMESDDLNKRLEKFKPPTAPVRTPQFNVDPELLHKHAERGQRPDGSTWYRDENADLTDPDDD